MPGPPYNYNNKECCVSEQHGFDDINKSMLPGPKLGTNYQYGGPFVDLYLAKSSRCLIHHAALQYWCLNIGGSDHPNRILLTPRSGNPSIELSDLCISDTAFHIFHQWTIDKRLPFFYPRVQRWNPWGISANQNDEIAAIEAYFLGWRLGAVVFTNQLMNAIAKMYDDKQDLFPPFCVFRKAFELLDIRNPMCRFLMHAWSKNPKSAEYLEDVPNKCGANAPEEFLWKIFRRLHTIKDLMEPGTFTRNICQYHVHFPKGSDPKKSWIKYLNELERGE